MDSGAPDPGGGAAFVAAWDEFAAACASDRPFGLPLTGYHPWVIIIIVLVTTTQVQEFGFSLMFRR